MFRFFKSEPTSLKIALIGSDESKKAFIAKLDAATPTEKTEGFQYILGVEFVSATINQQPFLFWNLHLGNDPQLILPAALNGANAILFCHADQTQQSIVKQTLEGRYPYMIHIKPEMMDVSHFLSDLKNAIHAHAQATTLEPEQLSFTA